MVISTLEPTGHEVFDFRGPSARPAENAAAVNSGTEPGRFRIPSAHPRNGG
jgi:hypothetical protein